MEPPCEKRLPSLVIVAASLGCSSSSTPSASSPNSNDPVERNCRNSPAAARPTAATSSRRRSTRWKLLASAGCKPRSRSAPSMSLMTCRDDRCSGWHRRGQTVFGTGAAFRARGFGQRAVPGGIAHGSQRAPYLLCPGHLSHGRRCRLAFRHDDAPKHGRESAPGIWAPAHPNPHPSPPPPPAKQL